MAFTACELAAHMVRLNEADAESAMLAELEYRQEWRKDWLAFAGLFLAFAVIAWPLALRV
jgi:hypothetical protein